MTSDSAKTVHCAVIGITFFAFSDSLENSSSSISKARAIASNTTLPVIGIPCKSAALDGIDALLSTVQMPSGIPVATVAIDGAANAALLSVQILALGEPELARALDEKRRRDAAAVLAKDAALAEQLQLNH